MVDGRDQAARGAGHPRRGSGSADRAPATSNRRWATLVAVCVSLMVITIDTTVLNVSLPTLARVLRADNSGLQWIVDAYTLVFAGLLLTAGALGDRFGRRRCLAVGLALFGGASAASALAGSWGQLTAARAAMGVGGALIMPATLSIITNVFTVPAERAKAIAVWAGVAALGLGLGPLAGGWLLQRFYWGSVFLVNLPVVAVALVGGRLVIPESRDTDPSRLDPVGAALSVAGLAAVIYGIIEGPQAGWSSPTILASLGAGVAALSAFVAWELRVDEPMLDMSFFRDRRFSAACVAIMTVFFALFSLMFILTQMLQSVLGYDTLAAGIRVLPLPMMLVVFAQVSARIAPRVGTKLVVTLGLLIVAVGLGVGATFGDHSGYGLLAVTLTLTGVGMGCTMAPATEAVMGSVPARKAGVGSAVNDTTRLSAGALGVAVVGTVLSAAFRSGLASALRKELLPPRALGSITNAVALARRLGGTRGDHLFVVAKHAFIVGADRGLVIAAVVAALGAVVAWRFLPAQAASAVPLVTRPVYEIHPIGWVDSPLVDRATAPRQGHEGAPDASLVFHRDMGEGIGDLQVGTEILVLTWLDRARRDVLVVHPRGDPDNAEQSVFSTRSPDRPNPIGLHRVQILSVDDTRLRVRPLEAIHGTPIVDVKPVLDRDRYQD